MVAIMAAATFAAQDAANIRLAGRGHIDSYYGQAFS